MVPQIPDLNRKAWADLEEVVRGAALKKGEVFVVTGPIFGGAKLKTIGGRVIVPTQTYKVVYVPSDRTLYAWIGDNATGKVTRSTLSDIEKSAGVRLFPALSGGESQAVDQRAPSAGGQVNAEFDPPRKSSGWEQTMQHAWKIALAVMVVVGGLYGRRRRW
jgi:endonuclease G